MIGRAIRRLRQDRSLTQSALADRLGISASYLNLIEHDQRKVTASLLIKTAELFQVDFATLAGTEERRAEAALREAFGDPALDGEEVPDAEREALAGLPRASASVLALHRALRVAREDASGIALPSGRRIQLPYEEAHDAFQDNANHFPTLELRAEAIGGDTSPAEMNHFIAERLRLAHGLTVRVMPLEGAIRHYDPAARALLLSEQLPRESRGFQMAFQLMLLEARDEIDTILGILAPSSKEAASIIRIGLLNYAAAALLMPYAAFLRAARALRHDFDALAARFSVSYEQACQRLTTLQAPSSQAGGVRGLPFFFLRTDLAGNISKRFSAGRFPFARYGGTCPRWIVHHAALTPGVIRVQVAELEDGATFLTIARCVAAPASGWGEPPPVHIIGMGCDIAHAPDLVYADGLDLRARVGIGLSCRLCSRLDCRSRAFPPLEHRLELDPAITGASPWRFSKV